MADQRAEAARDRGVAVFEFGGSGVRRDCVLVQRSAAATVFIGLGARALAALADPRLREVALRKQMETSGDEDPLHPRWPAKTPGSVGGEFRPKNEEAAGGEATPQRQTPPQSEAPPPKTDAPPKSELFPQSVPPQRNDLVPVGDSSPKGEIIPPDEPLSAAEAAARNVTRSAGKVAVKRLALRRSIRALVMQGLKMSLEIAANAVPILGAAADVLLVEQLADTFLDFYRLNVDTKAANDFLQNGPYRLEDLQVNPSNEWFSSYNEFYKGFLDQEDLEKRFGRAGDGQEYHHIVEQGGTNAANIPAGKLQSTENILRLPTLVHQAVSAEYSQMSEERPDLTVRQWMQTLPYERQREEGLKILRRLGIIRSEPSGWPSKEPSGWPSNR